MVELGELLQTVLSLLRMIQPLILKSFIWTMIRLEHPAQWSSCCIFRFISVHKPWTSFRNPLRGKKISFRLLRLLTNLHLTYFSQLRCWVIFLWGVRACCAAFVFCVASCRFHQLPKFKCSHCVSRLDSPSDCCHMSVIKSLFWPFWVTLKAEKLPPGVISKLDTFSDVGVLLPCVSASG